MVRIQLSKYWSPYWLAIWESVSVVLVAEVAVPPPRPVFAISIQSPVVFTLRSEWAMSSLMTMDPSTRPESAAPGEPDGWVLRRQLSFLSGSSEGVAHGLVSVIENPSVVAGGYQSDWYVTLKIRSPNLPSRPISSPVSESWLGLYWPRMSMPVVPYRDWNAARFLTRTPYWPTASVVGSEVKVKVMPMSNVYPARLMALESMLRISMNSKSSAV